jgi:hypothetical protein
MKEQVEELTKVLKEMQENVELMDYLINRPEDQHRIREVVDRYHSYLKINMQQISFHKQKLFKCLKPQTTTATS